MKYLICVLLVAFMGCGKGPQGIPGSPGGNGERGAAAVTGPVVEAGAACESGMGTIVSFYSDDQALGHYAVGDTYLNSIMTCDGMNGANATPVTVVQFCPASFVPTYPSTFPEVGFVINGQIYAVYSLNNGFLTLLTPGNYSSDGVNASCNFVVNSDGTVS
jgi:hypothetical protein